MHQIRKRAEPVYFTNWKKNFRQTHGREPVYDDFIGTSEYRQLKIDLVREQGYVCCYCEKEIGHNFDMKDCNIEHFMPRHPDKRLLTVDECKICRDAQLDYNNMYASCLGEEQDYIDHCNHKKDNWYDFNICIPLTDKKINDLFGFRLSGKIFAIGSDESTHEFLEHLNLDTYVLREQRKKAYDTVMEFEFEEDELWEDAAYVADTINHYKSMQNGRYEPFCSMITYCLEHYE